MPDTSFSIEDHYPVEPRPGVRKAEQQRLIDVSRPYITALLIATLLLSLWIGLCSV